MKKIIALALCALLIVPMTFAVSATDDLKDVTLRWDFNDLNEKNGLVSLVANDQSTANEDMVEFNDGVMSILGHAVDYDFSTPIVLDDAHDWSVEFRAALTDYSILLGSDTKGSLIYLAAGVGQWSNPIRIIPDGLESPIFVDSTNKGISFGDYLDAAYEMNTWRITYNAKDVTVVVEFLNDGEWEEVGSASTDQEYTITLTRMFGRYGAETFANFFGDIDYLEIHARAAVAAEPVETEPVETEPVETEPVETEPVETEPVETEPVETEPVETEPVVTEPVETEPVETDTPDAPATFDFVILPVVALAAAAAGVVVFKKKN